MKEEKKVWIESNDIFYLQDIKKQHKKLHNWVFTLEQDGLGNKFLKKIGERFEFDYKIYGLEKKLISRIQKTFENSSGNLGVLLNGLKGTGKTVTSKMICNELGMPTIIVDSNYPDGHVYLNDIPQDITIFIDEYEKIFEKDSDMLTIMDGALNSEHRRVFLLTTNNLYVNENLIQRPGRIRYLKTFRDLSSSVIREILEDILIHKEHIEATVAFIATLEVITVDVVKSICQEVNIHNEPPKDFADVFNVKKLVGNHDVYMVSADGKSETLLAKNVKVSPRKDFDPIDTLHNSFYIDSEYVGEVVEVIDEETVKIQGRIDSDSTLGGILEEKAKSENRGKNPLELESPKKRRKTKEEYGEFILRVQNSMMVHRTYRWSDWNF